MKLSNGKVKQHLKRLERIIGIFEKHESAPNEFIIIVELRRVYDKLKETLLQTRGME